MTVAPQEFFFSLLYFLLFPSSKSTLRNVSNLDLAKMKRGRADGHLSKEEFEAQEETDDVPISLNDAVWFFASSIAFVSH